MILHRRRSWTRVEQLARDVGFGLRQVRPETPRCRTTASPRGMPGGLSGASCKVFGGQNGIN